MRHFAYVNQAPSTPSPRHFYEVALTVSPVRILRLLTVHNLIAETTHQTWKPLPLGLGFATGSPLPEVAKHFYANMKASANLDEFLDATDYQNPTDTYNVPWQFAYKTNDHYFDWLTQNPEDAHAFNVTMRINRQVEGAQWFDIYPVEGRLSVSSNDRVQLVDIGGGLGHDLAGLKRKFPNLPGRLVLEDLPDVIEHAKESTEDGIEVVGYDIFTEQPLKGAKAYYLRTVLHDWPDKQSLLTLARVREAMADDSVLLINENTLPEVGASSFSVSLDINMMNIFAALERTEKQWVDLLERAGFRVVKIWRADYDGVGSNALFKAVVCQL